MPKGPLEGIKVVGFTWYVAGPQVTKILAALGAEVIKIEGRKRHDPQRRSRDSTDAISLNHSGIFNAYNTGNLSIALNLAHSKGVELAKKIIARADIVVDNFAGGAMKRMGLGYEELRKLKPDIIMLSSCTMGQTGPQASLPGTGNHLTNMSGFGLIAGWPDRQPVNLGIYTDHIAPRISILAIMAALDYRRRTGKGQYLDLSQYEGGVHFMAPLVMDYTVNQRIAGTEGNHSQYAAPHGAYRCQGEDRWCAIAVFTDEEWESFRKVIGDPEWTKDISFSTLLARKRNEDELDKLVEGWAMNHSAEEVMTMMQLAGVGAGVLQTGEDVMDRDPQLRHRHLFWELDHPEVGKYRASGTSFKLSKAPYEMQRAPLLGEHNEYIFKEVLSMSDKEIAEMVIEGVIE